MSGFTNWHIVATLVGKLTFAERLLHASDSFIFKCDTPFNLIDCFDWFLCPKVWSLCGLKCRRSLPQLAQRYISEAIKMGAGVGFMVHLPLPPVPPYHLAMG